MVRRLKTARTPKPLTWCLMAVSLAVFENSDAFVGPTRWRIIERAQTKRAQTKDTDANAT
jgi:hypothetical protein